jgi:hypothetical protein
MGCIKNVSLENAYKRISSRKMCLLGMNLKKYGMHLKMFLHERHPNMCE